MSTFLRVSTRVVLGILVTYAAATSAAYVRAFPWIYPVTHPLETLALFAMYPSESELVHAWHRASEVVRGHYFVLLPLGALLGLVSGALLPRRPAPLYVLTRVLLFGAIAVIAFSGASVSLTLYLGAPLRIWDEFLRINGISLPFVFAYAGAWHGLCGFIAYQWRKRWPAARAA